MGSEPTTLTPADVRRFERDGYVVVRQAFSRDDGCDASGGVNWSARHPDDRSAGGGSRAT